MRAKIKITAVLLILALLAVKAVANFKTAAHQFCKYDVNNALNLEINRQVLNFIVENKSLQSNICSFDRQDGVIKSINVDSYAVSYITAQICENLISAISEFGNSGFGMPLGNATGLLTLSGKGPKIKIKTVPLGNIAYDTESQFISAGINQTLFKLVLKITCAYETLAPFSKESGQLYFTYTLCEAVIIGDVPQLYLH